MLIFGSRKKQRPLVSRSSQAPAFDKALRERRQRSLSPRPTIRSLSQAPRWRTPHGVKAKQLGVRIKCEAMPAHTVKKKKNTVYVNYTRKKNPDGQQFCFSASEPKAEGKLDSMNEEKWVIGWCTSIQNARTMNSAVQFSLSQVLKTPAKKRRKKKSIMAFLQLTCGLKMLRHNFHVPAVQ